MTPKQNLLYWRLWGEVCRAREWRMRKGRITPAPPESPEETIILGIAANLANSHHRATTPEDLRHASHYYAAGKDIGHDALTQPQIDKLFALWHLIRDPANLDAAIALENPDVGARKRLVHQIKTHAPEYYILHICADQFAGQYTPPFWEDLPVASLRALHLTIRTRTANWSRPIPELPRNLRPEPALDCPY